MRGGHPGAARAVDEARYNLPMHTNTDNSPRWYLLATYLAGGIASNDFGLTDQHAEVHPP